MLRILWRPLRILAKLDGVCDLERGTMQIGAVSTELERLWHVKAPSR